MSTDEERAQRAKAVFESGFIDTSERKRCESEARSDGKVVVITGANTGIGKETALQLSLRGAKIYIACRDLTRAYQAIDDIKKTNPEADITALALDLSSFKSVREFVEELKSKESVVDILINNAGVFTYQRSETEDGFEIDIQVNYLGHFLLTLLVLPLLKESNKARVINVSSGAYLLTNLHLDNINMTGISDPSTIYGHSKLAQVLFTREMARRLGKNSNVNVYVLHPGVVESELGRDAPTPTKSVIPKISGHLGAQTTLYCALEESLDDESGFYYEYDLLYFLR